LLKISCSPNPYEEGTESHLAFYKTAKGRRAAAQIPMKRELKGNSCPCLSHVRRSAAAQIPMKRELKDIDTIDSIIGNGQWLQPKSL